MKQKIAIIIGAGPAGLTAAYELLIKTDIKPIIIEKSKYVGGISKTIKYKGNRIDIGGHRFFSKSDKIMEWWLKFLPIQENKKNSNNHFFKPAYKANNKVMLVRKRKSRIYFNRTFFDYPVSLSLQTIKDLGLIKTFAIGLSYIKQTLFPIKNEKNLEDFFINRFGKQLYLTFFKSYTEKVWGYPCNEISAEWGAQRIKGLSITKTVSHVIKKIFKNKNDISQKNTETTLIEQFLYPKYGPGQMWEVVSEKIKELGGSILFEHEINKIYSRENKITQITAKNLKTNSEQDLEGYYFISSMPVQDLINSLQQPIPKQIKDMSDGLVYRDFLTLGLLVNKLKIKEKDGSFIKDNWIYIQEPDVKVGRLQIFNNWSPYMVQDQTKIWIGLEYFCFKNDELWNKKDKELIEFASSELEKIGIINKYDVIDATVIREEKTYPAYFGTYDKFDQIKNYLNQFTNLFLIGRNGMHKYNNQDHSMLSAMTAVENIINNIETKENIWAVNAEREYHEGK